jgi:hypothetical protein
MNNRSSSSTSWPIEAWLENKVKVIRGDHEAASFSLFQLALFFRFLTLTYNYYASSTFAALLISSQFSNSVSNVSVHLITLNFVCHRLQPFPLSFSLSHFLSSFSISMPRLASHKSMLSLASLFSITLTDQQTVIRIVSLFQAIFAIVAIFAKVVAFNSSLTCCKLIAF